MVRYFVTHQEVTFSCGQITVVMRSSSSVHLWLLWTTKDPFIKPRPFRNQESERPHQNNYSLEIHGDVEQDEPGDTTKHTFVFNFPPGAQRLYFYAINLSIGGIKASRTPIFAYELTYTPIAEELWQSNQPPTFPWSYSVGTLNPPFTHGRGFALLPTAYNAPAVLETNFGTALTQQQRETCNLTLTAYIAAIPPPEAPQGAALLATVLYFNQALQTEARDLIATRVIAPCDAGFDNILGEFSVPGTARFALQTAADTTSGPCSFPFDPVIPNPLLASFRLILSVGGTTGPGLPLTWLVGPVRVYTSAGTLTDVSDRWRHYRIHPFIP